MGLHTLITRTTDTVIAATTSAARAVTAATTSAAGATGGAALGAGLGAARGAADGLRNGAERGSRSAPAAALTVTALTVTGILDWPLVWPPAAPPSWSTGSPSTRPARHHTRRPHPPPHAPRHGPPENPDAAIPGRGGPAATRSDPAPSTCTCTCTCTDEGVAGWPGATREWWGAGRVAHGEFSCSDRSWVASLTVRPALTPCRTPRTHPQPRLQVETSPSPKRLASSNIRAANVPHARPHVPLTHRGTAHELCRTLSRPPGHHEGHAAKRVYPR